MAIPAGQMPSDDFLMRLVKDDFKAKIKAEILSEVMKDIEPLIEAAAIKTVESLDAAIHSYMDNARMETVTKLVINTKEVPHGTRR